MKKFINAFSKAIAHNEKNDKKKSFKITYKKLNGRTVKRKIDPVSIKNNVVVAFDHKRQALRSFKVERLKGMEKAAEKDYESKPQPILHSLAGGLLGGATGLGLGLASNQNSKDIMKLLGAAGLAGLGAGLLKSQVDTNRLWDHYGKLYHKNKEDNKMEKSAVETVHDHYYGVKPTTEWYETFMKDHGKRFTHSERKELEQKLIKQKKRNILLGKSLGIMGIAGTIGGSFGAHVADGFGKKLLWTVPTAAAALLGSAGAVSGEREKELLEDIQKKDYFGVKNMKKQAFWTGFEKQAKELTYKSREALPDSAFVFPKERKYPIHDKKHARNAISRVAQFGSSSEQAAVRKAVHSKFPDIGQEKEALDKSHAYTAGAGALAGLAGGGYLGHILGRKKGQKDVVDYLQQVQAAQKQAALSDHLTHGVELAGLGVLAAPALKHMVTGKDMSEKNKSRAEVAGLGILAAPSLHHFLTKKPAIPKIIK